MKKALYIFGQLSDSDIEWMLNTGHTLRLRRGEVLIESGSRLDALYILLEGVLSVQVGSQQIAKLGAGEIVGEMSFVDSRPTGATVKILEDSLIFAIPKSLLNDRLEQDREFAANFYRVLAIFLSYKLRDASTQLGYGTSGVRPDDSDELDETLLDNVYLAGTRFEYMLKRLQVSQE